MKSKLALSFGLVAGLVVALVAYWNWPMPVSAEKQAAKIQASLESGNFQAVLEASQKILTAQPKNTQAQWWRGQALEGLGRVSEALQVYQEAPLIEGDVACARCKLRCSELYFQQGNANEVERYLKQALQAKEDLVEANYQMYLILTLQARRWEGEPYLMRLGAFGEAELEDLVLMTLSSLYISDTKIEISNIIIEPFSIS